MSAHTPISEHPIDPFAALCSSLIAPRLRTHARERPARIPTPVGRRHSLSAPTCAADGCRTFGGYTDSQACQRELVVLGGAGGSLLVVDRDATTLADRRLVAHLAADEPAENVALVCGRYLEQPAGRWCRRLSAEDLLLVPFEDATLDLDEHMQASPESSQLSDRQGRLYRLALIPADMSIPEQRWCVQDDESRSSEALSVREVVGRLESYEPVMRLSAQAVAAHRHDPEVSVATLSAELERMRATRIVLNRGLREAVLASVASQSLSMSEIAIRCGRVKRDSRGIASGETSWLARRVGILPEGGARNPTPWVHSEVLGLIARNGLGLSPHEVEVG